MRHLACLLVLCVPPAFAWAAWPQFRGPTGDGVAPADCKPVTKWAEGENVVWKTPIHDKGWSSPVVLDGQIWMTTAKAEGKEFFAVCVDAETGKVTHDIQVFSEDKSAFSHPYNSYASPTPVVEKGRVYVHFGRHGTACLDTSTGKKIWERRDLDCDHFRGPASSPIIDDKNIYLLFDGFDVQYVEALDKATGKTAWHKDRDIKFGKADGDIKKAYATASIITVEGKRQLICPAAEQTIAYDPATGEELWRVSTGGMNQAAKPVFGHGMIYLTSGHSGNLLAVKQGATGLLGKDDVVWKSNRSVPTRPSVLLVGERIFMVNDNGIASWTDAKNGKQLWQERVGGKFCASPVFANGNIFMSDEDGKTHVIKAGDEFERVATNDLKDGCMASMAFEGDVIYLRTKSALYKIGKTK